MESISLQPIREALHWPLLREALLVLHFLLLNGVIDLVTATSSFLELARGERGGVLSSSLLTSLVTSEEGSDEGWGLLGDDITSIVSFSTHVISTESFSVIASLGRGPLVRGGGGPELLLGYLNVCN